MGLHRRTVMLNRFLEWVDEYSDLCYNAIRLAILVACLVIIAAWMGLHMTIELARLFAAVSLPFLWFMSVVAVAGMFRQVNEREESRAWAAIMSSVVVPLTVAVTLYATGFLEVSV